MSTNDAPSKDVIDTMDTPQIGTMETAAVNDAPQIGITETASVDDTLQIEDNLGYPRASSINTDKTVNIKTEDSKPQGEITYIRIQANGLDEIQKMKTGVKAAVMEQKWDIDYISNMDDTGGRLEFRRSWTKDLIFIAECDESGIISYKCNEDKLKTSADHRSMFCTVVEHVLFKRPLEHDFIFGEDESMRLWSLIGQDVMN